MRLAMLLLVVACGQGVDTDPPVAQVWHGFLFGTTACRGTVVMPPAFIAPGTGAAEWTLELSQMTADGGACAVGFSVHDGGLDVTPGSCGAGRIERGRLEPLADGGLWVDIETSQAQCHHQEWGVLTP